MAEDELSTVVIRFEDLKRLQEIALDDLEGIISRKPEQKPFKKKLFFIALTRGAAQHYLDRKTGIRDFNVCLFFKQAKEENTLYQRAKKKASGLDKFGPDPGGKTKTRQVEVRGWEIPTGVLRKGRSNPEKCLEFWFEKAEGEVVEEIAKEAVVGLWPDNIIGKILWSP
jgi:hypothetical protein